MLFSRSSIVWVCLLVLAASLPGCGYASKPLYPAVQSVAVPIFANSNPQLYRDVEFDLNEALIKEIELRTPYKVVAGPAAETLLQGTITGVEQRRLSVTRTGGLPQEMELVLTVNLTWRDQKTGRVLRDRQGMEIVGRYTPAQPVSQTLATAQHQAVEQMARQIVDLMREDW